MHLAYYHHNENKHIGDASLKKHIGDANVPVPALQQQKHSPVLQHCNLQEGDHPTEIKVMKNWIIPGVD